MVPGVGIEPTLLAEPDFESGASTSFTTPAQVRLKAAQSSDGAPWRKRSMTGALTLIAEAGGAGAGAACVTVDCEIMSPVRPTRRLR